MIIELLHLLSWTVFSWGFLDRLKSVNVANCLVLLMLVNAFLRRGLNKGFVLTFHVSEQ